MGCTGSPPGAGRQNACRAEKVLWPELQPVGTRFHHLRHFYASGLIAANLNPKVIQARLGHASITETMDTYTCSPTQKTSAAVRSRWY